MSYEAMSQQELGELYDKYDSQVVKLMSKLEKEQLSADEIKSLNEKLDSLNKEVGIIHNVMASRILPLDEDE